MRIMINEPDGRISGIVVGETVGIDYDKYFKFKELQGKSGKETIAVLQEAIENTSVGEAGDYEKLITEKMLNVLHSLLDMAKKNPEGIWRVS